MTSKITIEHRENFNHTFLYIKRHTITGKLYFGKMKIGKRTKSTSIETYKGSGTYWTNHYKKYGKECIETIWYCLFTDIDEMYNFAVAFQKNNEIVESNDWANKIEETGLDGFNNTGYANAKTSSGEKLGHVSVSDIRWKTGEIVGASKWCTREKQSMWNYGLTKETSDKLFEIASKIQDAKKGKPSWNKGKTKTTDAAVEKYARQLQISCKGKESPHKGQKRPNLAGELNPQCRDEVKAKISAKNTGKVEYNDGKTTKRFFLNCQPEGWVKGRIWK